MDDIEIQPDIQEQVVRNVPDLFRVQQANRLDRLVNQDERDNEPIAYHRPERSGVQALSEGAQMSGVEGETAKNRRTLMDKIRSLGSEETGSSKGENLFSGSPEEHRSRQSKDTPQGLVDAFPELPQGMAKENPHITGSTGHANIEYLGDDLKQLLGQARSQISEQNDVAKQQTKTAREALSNNQSHDIENSSGNEAPHGGNNEDSAQSTDQTPGLGERTTQGFQGLRDEMEDVGRLHMSSPECPPTRSTIYEEPKASRASTLPFVGKTVKKDERQSPSFAEELKDAVNESGQRVEDNVQQRKSAIQHVAENAKEGIKSLLQTDTDDAPPEQENQLGRVVRTNDSFPLMPPASRSKEDYKGMTEGVERDMPISSSGPSSKNAQDMVEEGKPSGAAGSSTDKGAQDMDHSVADLYLTEDTKGETPLGSLDDKGEQMQDMTDDGKHAGSVGPTMGEGTKDTAADEQTAEPDQTGNQANPPESARVHKSMDGTDLHMKVFSTSGDEVRQTVDEILSQDSSREKWGMQSSSVLQELASFVHTIQEKLTPSHVNTHTANEDTEVWPPHSIKRDDGIEEQRKQQGKESYGSLDQEGTDISEDSVADSTPAI